MAQTFARLALSAGIALALVTQPHALSPKPKTELTAAQSATRERMSKCSAEWKQAKTGGKIEAGLKWPKFWSQCNARLKGTKT